MQLFRFHAESLNVKTWSNFGACVKDGKDQSVYLCKTMPIDHSGISFSILQPLVIHYRCSFRSLQEFSYVDLWGPRVIKCVMSVCAPNGSLKTMMRLMHLASPLHRNVPSAVWSTPFPFTSSRRISTLVFDVECQNPCDGTVFVQCWQLFGALYCTVCRLPSVHQGNQLIYFSFPGFLMLQIPGW